MFLSVCLICFIYSSIHLFILDQVSYSPGWPHTCSLGFHSFYLHPPGLGSQSHTAMSCSVLVAGLDERKSRSHVLSLISLSVRGFSLSQALGRLWCAASQIALSGFSCIVPGTVCSQGMAVRDYSLP